MTKLVMAAALVFTVACKADPPAKTDPASTGTETGDKARSAKIDVKPVPPAAPEPPAADSQTQARRPLDESKLDWSERRKRVDADGDGVISDEERQNAMRERMASLRTRLDRDGDGKVTVEELAAARGRLHFDDPASIDTNHDGDISADELAAAMRERRLQRRGGSAAPPAQ